MSEVSAEPVTVIVPTHNDGDRLRQCLAALAAQAGAPTFDVCVVDDASSDHTSAVVKAFEAHQGVAWRHLQLLRLERNVGPAAARNAGAAECSSELLFFVDADCVAHTNAVARVAQDLSADAPHDAVFGSYDDAPAHLAFVSRWKNLAHHHTHQVARPEASTFWSGCGAIRREVFLKHGGFDAQRYGRPCIEDIDLGLRCSAAGHRIRLDNALQVKHLKRWRLWKLIKTDIFDRGLPWTVAMLREAKAGRRAASDLNVSTSQKVSALLVAMVIALLIGGGVWFPLLPLVPIAAVLLMLAYDTLTARSQNLLLQYAMLVLLLGLALAALAYAWPAVAPAMLALGGMVALNRSLYRLLLRNGFPFVAYSVVMHCIYYICAMTGFVLGHVTARLSAQR